MKKLKWWQWVLIAFFGVGVLGNLIDGPRKDRPAQQQQFVPADPTFKPLANNAVIVMTFDKGADPRSLPDLARDQCGSKAWCKVLGWTDSKLAARGWPMTNREVAGLDFSYSLNRATGSEQILWNCRRWPALKSPSSGCIGN